MSVLVHLNDCAVWEDGFGSLKVHLWVFRAVSGYRSERPLFNSTSYKPVSPDPAHFQPFRPRASDGEYWAVS